MFACPRPASTGTLRPLVRTSIWLRSGRIGACSTVDIDIDHVRLADPECGARRRQVHVPAVEIDEECQRVTLMIRPDEGSWGERIEQRVMRHASFDHHPG